MIRSIEFTVKGDYSSIDLSRDQGSTKVQLRFHYYNGCALATFDFADLKNAVELLTTADDDE